jgi:hypothetical protein
MFSVQLTGSNMFITDLHALFVYCCTAQQVINSMTSAAVAMVVVITLTRMIVALILLINAHIQVRVHTGS